MLRQVFLFYKQEQIFSYYFAQGYDNDTIKMLITQRLKPYIINPMEGKVFSKPMFDFQAHYGMFKGVFYLFVTDMADRPKTIASEIERAAKLFQKNFSDPIKIKKKSSEREEFTIFIKETHYYLHPKIALMGPNGSGKTTITNLLKLENSPDKKIMNFAEYYRIKIGQLYFDLWDFVEPDDFSPLWNNFIRGSDIIFFILDARKSKIVGRKIQFFSNLKRRDGKYSNWVIILTHQDAPDFIGTDLLKEKFETIRDAEFYEIDLTSPTAEDDILSIFRETIGLKKPLPPDFKIKLEQANEFVGEEKYREAITLLEELSVISREYQEFTYLSVFENKIDELKEKLEIQRKREEREKRKIKAPKKIDFGGFKGPKSLDKEGALKKPEIKSKPTPTNLPKVAALPSKPQVKPKTPSLPVINKDEQVLKSVETQDKVKSNLDDSLINDMGDANPFFGGLKSSSDQTLTKKKSSLSSSQVTKDEPKPLQAKSLRQQKPKVKEIPFQSSEEVENLEPIPQNEPGAPLEQFKIKIHKVKPIDLTVLDSPVSKEQHQELAEKVMKESLSEMKSGQKRDRKLTFERSPLVSDEKVKIKQDIKQTKKPSKPKAKPTLSSLTFTVSQSQQKNGSSSPSTPAEKLGAEIRALGESLSHELCKKFIQQLKIRLNKTNLTDQDIKKAASLYVIQRRKKQ